MVVSKTELETELDKLKTSEETILLRLDWGHRRAQRNSLTKELMRIRNRKAEIEADITFLGR